MASTPSIFKYIGSVLDDTKVFVDGLVKKAVQIEDDVKHNVSKLYSGYNSGPSELEQLRAAVTHLTANVGQLQTAGTGRAKA